MKRIYIGAIGIFVLTILFTQTLSAQSHIRNEESNISLKIPRKFVKISQNNDKSVYQEESTKAIYTVEKLGFSDFDTEILLQEEIDFHDKKKDQNCVDVVESTSQYKISSGYKIDWSTIKRERYKYNDHNTQVLMQLNGTLYRFTVSYSKLNKKSAIKTFDKFLNSALPIYDER